MELLSVGITLCISYLLLLQLITTNLVGSNNTNLFSYSSGLQKSRIKVLVEVCSSQRLCKILCLFQLPGAVCIIVSQPFSPSSVCIIPTSGSIVPSPLSVCSLAFLLYQLLLFHWLHSDNPGCSPPSSFKSFFIYF